MYGSTLVRNIVFVLDVRVKQYAKSSERIADRRIEKSIKRGAVASLSGRDVVRRVSMPIKIWTTPPIRSEIHTTGSGAR
jgi:hypothetical protein